MYSRPLVSRLDHPHVCERSGGGGGDAPFCVVNYSRSCYPHPGMMGTEIIGMKLLQM